MSSDAPGNLTSASVTFPNGANLFFGYVFAYYSAVADVYVTRQTDRWGRVLTNNYSVVNGAVHLTSISDPDGRSTTFTYGQYYRTNAITKATDPWGRTVQLGTDNQSGTLTYITDAAGLTSYLYYDSTNGWLTSLTTPYGTTSFLSTGTTSPLPDDYSVNRSCTVTYPTGGKELFIYRRRSTQLNNTNSTPLIPTNWPSAEVPTLPYANTLESTTFMDFHNSFHWDRKQYDALNGAFQSSGDFNALTTNDYFYARMRHWLRDANDTFLAGTLSMQWEGSPDGTTRGQTTWYDYPGKNDVVGEGEGTNSFPQTIAMVLPNGQTNFTYIERNWESRPTLLMTTYGDGSAYRTNILGYYSNGQDLQYERGPNGELLRGYSYNGNHQVTSYTNAVGDVTTYSYDGQGRIYQRTLPSGLVTTYSYGTDGFISQVADSPVNRTESYTYLNSFVRTYTDARGMARTYTYDNLQRPTEVDYPDTTSEQFGYTYLDLTSQKDRLSNWTYFGYDAIRQKVAETNANSVVTRYGYCDCGALMYVTNALGTAQQTVTSFTYDTEGNRTAIYYPDGTSLTNVYDPLRRITNRLDALSSTTYWFNNQGLRVALSNGVGQVSKIIYDNEDRATNVVDANGVTVTQAFDNLERVLSRTYPDAGVESFGYNCGGLVAYTNQIGKVWTYAYDAASRRTNAVTPNSETITNSYNAAGDLLTLTDGKNQETTWQYDQYGHVTNKLDATSTSILQYSYDADGRLTHRWSAAKGNTAYGYDAVGNLTQIKYPSSGTNTYTYDPLNRLTTMVDAAGTNVYTYTTAGDLASEDGPWPNDTVSYTYHSHVPHLRIGLSLQQPGGNWSKVYGYDAGTRLKTVTSPAGTFVYTYNGAGSQVGSINLPIPPYITNYFDSVGRQYWTILQNLEQSGYAYNKAGQRITVYRADNSYDTVTYDNDGQVQSAVGSGSESTENLGYLYDPAWNLSHRTNASVVTAFGVNNLNELTSEPNGTPTHDGNGNLTSESNGRSFVYDDENQLTSVSYATSYRSDFVYDGLGRRRKEIDYAYSGGWYPTGETRFVYDGRTVVQERDGNNSVKVSYTRGSDLSGSLQGAGGIGGLLARSTGPSSGTLVTSVSTGGTLRNNFSGWVGFQFTVGNSPLTVSSLGRWIVSGNANSHTVALFTSAGNQIAGSAVTVNTAGVPPGQFAYATLSSPVTLAANTAYEIMSLESSGGDYWYNDAGTTITLSGDAGGAVSVWAYSNPPPYYGSTSGASYGPVNLQYSTASNFSHAYYHADGNGNIAIVVGSAQNYLGVYRYDPYGNAVYTYDIMTPANVYRFSSKEWHANSGLYYYGFRFYDPNLQRWLNRDPIYERGGINLYRAFRNGPVNLVDTDGRGVMAPLPVLINPETLPIVINPIGGSIVGAICLGWAGQCAINHFMVPPDPGPAPLPLPPGHRKPHPKPPKPPPTCKPAPNNYREECTLAEEEDGWCTYNCPSGPRFIPSGPSGCPDVYVFTTPPPDSIPREE